MPNQITAYHNRCKGGGQEVASENFLIPEEITVIRNRDTLVSTYSFLCQHCGSLALNKVDKKYAEILRLVGAHQQETGLPPELFEEAATGEPLTVDDQIDYHNELEGFPDTLVGHRDLQDQWERVVIDRSRL